jgi:hypothetical protein
MYRATCVYGFALLILCGAGCGKQSDGGKATQSAGADNATASERAHEPRGESGSAATTSPSGKKTRVAVPPITTEPATLEEVLKVVDLQQMPKPENAKVKIATRTRLFYSVPGTLADSTEFCKNKLSEMDWIEDDVKMPGLDPNKYVYAGFDKAGFHISLSVSKSNKEGLIDVSLTNLGNVDPRRLPRPADAKATFDFWHYVSYATATKPQEAIALCRKELTAKGWKEYAVSSAKFHATEGRFLAGFVNNAMDCSLNAKAQPDGTTVVDYRMTIRETPPRSQNAVMPKGATLSEGMKAIDLNRFPRLAGAEPGRGSSADMYYEAAGDTLKGVAFYREKLKADGWKEKPRNTIGEIEDFLTTSFDKGAFHLKLQINNGDQPNRVRIHIVNKGNIDVRQFPRLADAAVGGLEGFDDVRYETETKPDVATEFYRKELIKREWKELTSKSKDYPDGTKTLVFTQKAIILSLRIDKDSVRIQSELLGDRIPRPASEQDTLYAIDLRELPRMKGASAARVDSARVEYTVASTMADALQFHQGAFAKLRWAERLPRPSQSPDRAHLRFTKGLFLADLTVTAKDSNELTVLVQHRGDLDLRELLHPLDAKIDPPGDQDEITLTTSLSAEAVKDFYRQELPKFGWKETAGSSKQALEMTQNATKMTITVIKSAGDMTTVQLQASIIGKK